MDTFILYLAMTLDNVLVILCVGFAVCSALLVVAIIMWLGSDSPHDTVDCDKCKKRFVSLCVVTSVLALLLVLVPTSNKALIILGYQNLDKIEQRVKQFSDNVFLKNINKLEDK